MDIHRRRQEPGSEAANQGKLLEAKGIALKLGILREGETTRFGFHVLRHRLASFLVSQNASPTVVQKSLRHSNFAATLGL